MNIPARLRLRFAAALLALAALAQAQTVQFRAVIGGDQAVPAATSGATGTAVMIYNLSANTFDLVVTLSNFTGPLVASQIEEGAIGATGTVLTSLGAESAYLRSGNSLTTTLRSVPFSSAKLLTLLQNGMFLNFTSAAFPAGEIRGQLIAQPKRLYANIDVNQERATFPANVNLPNALGFGAAVMTYDPGTNRLNLRVSLYNYSNTLTASHYHEQAPALSGPVVTNLGAGTVSNYAISGGHVSGTFLNLNHGGDRIKLLTGGAYLNFHSNINPQGEARGQIYASEELLGSRVINLSARGTVSASEPLIGGIVVTGPEPVRVLFTARGPSLAAYGVTNSMANPSLAVFDSAGRRIAANDDVGTVSAGSELASIYGVPTSALESALVLVLPPGVYTAVVSSATATGGVAILEAYDVRTSTTVNANATGTVAEFAPDSRTIEEFMADILASDLNPRLAARAVSARVLELCGLPVEPGATTVDVPKFVVTGR